LRVMIFSRLFWDAQRPDTETLILYIPFRVPNLWGSGRELVGNRIDTSDIQ